jgi:hypothetical protein
VTVGLEVLDERAGRPVDASLDPFPPLVEQVVVRRVDQPFAQIAAPTRKTQY